LDSKKDDYRVLVVAFWCSHPFVCASDW